MVILTWILSAVSVLGVAGTVAAFIFVPLTAAPIATKVVDWLLGCKTCLIVAAFVAVTLGSYWYGYHSASSECRADALAAELVAKQADVEHAKKSEADATTRANTIEATANDQRAKDADYIAKLEARPACLLDDSDIGGVRTQRPAAARAKPAARAK